MSKERKEVIRVIDVDTEKLFSSSLSETIKYLQKVEDVFKGRDLDLVQVWDGYEDCHFEFNYTELETDEELKERLELEEWRKEEEKKGMKRIAQAKKDRAEFNRLKIKLGAY